MRASTWLLALSAATAAGFALYFFFRKTPARSGVSETSGTVTDEGSRLLSDDEMSQAPAAVRAFVQPPVSDVMGAKSVPVDLWNNTPETLDLTFSFRAVQVHVLWGTSELDRQTVVRSIDPLTTLRVNYHPAKNQAGLMQLQVFDLTDGSERFLDSGSFFGGFA